MADPTKEMVLTVAHPAAGVQHRRRRWWLMWAALAVLALAGGAVGMVALQRTALTHQLMDADFEIAAAPFLIGASTQYRFDLVDRTYRISSTTTPNSPAEAFAWFARTTSNVDVAVDVVAVEHATVTTGVGVGCADSPNDNNHGYLFAVFPGGYVLARSDLPSTDVLTTVDTSHEWPAGAQRLRITCSPSTPLNDKEIDVRGYVDGVEVISFTDSNGFGTFRTAVLYLVTPDEGVAVRFDNVKAVVPGG